MLRTISLHLAATRTRGLRTLSAVAAAGVLAAAAVPAVAMTAGTPAHTTVVAGESPDDHGWD
ncbi:predicted protein [Streptomyces viridochromogenes DSM 40736]|uniref:Predicted protein n=1 Tax=Streptomyces viridochromogenes (strain DSM 40736 / JCM 4977 / BCRC 1201 / Tue 494) TaxID=591159 RepID=D9X6T0_STRVT|nr:hypothetical protein [Streptomyces viridochromogenes]EFL33997.1 predicted protein [Streptomyces viridochromogenes DSM 40736]